MNSGIKFTSKRSFPNLNMKHSSFLIHKYVPKRIYFFKLNPLYLHKFNFSLQINIIVREGENKGLLFNKVPGTLYEMSTSFLPFVIISMALASFKPLTCPWMSS